MFFLLGFLCCLVHAVAYDLSDRTQYVMLVPAVSARQITLYDGRPLHSVPYYYVIGDKRVLDDESAEKGSPLAKKNCTQTEVFPENPGRALRVPPVQERPAEEAVVSPSAETYVVEQDDDARLLRQKEILCCLSFYQGQLVPEKDLGELYKIDLRELLEDVLALIAERHDIIYENKRYMLRSRELLPPFKAETHVMAQDDEARLLRQKGILCYLSLYQGRFVHEEGLGERYKIDLIELLEDVLALIAERHDIIYEDERYMLRSRELLPPFKAETYVVAQDDEARLLRQKGILCYLSLYQGQFVPAEDLGDLYEINLRDLLEDVMALIAERHDIVYEDKQYTLRSRELLPPFQQVNQRALIKKCLMDKRFQSLSAAGQSHYIYKEKGHYIPVSTVALWITGLPQEATPHGFSDFRFQRLLFFKDKVLQDRKLLTKSEYYRLYPDLGFWHCNDFSLLKESLKLYAHGLEVLECIGAQKRSSCWEAPDVRNPRILLCLQQYKGKPVAQKHLLTMVNSGMSHRHRELYRVIACLRAQRYNITYADGKFTLEEGVWEIVDRNYQKALWTMLDDPEYKGVNAVEFFLKLSNMHYNPCESVVEEIMLLKNFCAGRSGVKDFALKKQMWSIILKDQDVKSDPQYYQRQLNTQGKITKQTLKRLKCLFSRYCQVVGDVQSEACSSTTQDVSDS